MKKHLFVAAVAGAALAGCVSEERMEQADKGQKLSFDAPALATQTRGEVTGEIAGTDYPDAEKFMVYAKLHESGKFTEKGWSGSQDFWATENSAALEVSKEGSTWETEDDYYWPHKDFALTFAAYSPSVLPEGAQVSYGETGLTVTDFPVDMKNLSHTDLMYSGRIANKDASVGTTGVNVPFKHALASVVFHTVEEDNHADYVINALTVHGNMYASGTFKENLANTGIDVTKSSWELAANKTAFSYTLVGTDEFTVTTEEQAITGGTTAMLPIPQDAPSDAAITITYTVTPTKGKPYTRTDKKVPLTYFKKADSYSITEWNQATRYIYLIKFAGSELKIVFSPNVTEWLEGGTAVYVFE